MATSFFLTIISALLLNSVIAQTVTELLPAGEATTSAPLSLGSEPYRCLGDINYCPSGFTFSFRYTPSPGNRQQRWEYLASSGGQSGMSEGLYVRRNYGMEYEVGVALGETVWVGTFHLRDGVESHVAITWNNNLSVYVDGKLADSDASGKWRVYTAPMYDPFPVMYLGKANDDRTTSDASRDIALRDVIHADQVYTQQQVFEMTDDAVYLRSCQSTPDPSATGPATMTSEVPAQECRQLCAQSDAPLVLSVISASECYCWTLTEEELSALPIAGDDGCPAEEYSVYRVSSVMSVDDVMFPISFQYEVIRATEFDYIRPDETLVFLFTTDTEETVEFEVSFGDDVTKLTNEPRISYAYSEVGNYTVTMTAITRTSRESLTHEVEITWIKEGIAPELVLLKSSLLPHVGEAVVGLDLTAISHEVLSCNVNLGDGNIQTFTDMDSFINRESIQHDYDLPGYYDLFVSCSNEYGERNFTSQIVAVTDTVEYQTDDRSTDVTMAIWDADANTESFRVEIDQEVVTSAVVDAANVTLPASVFTYSGQHLIELKANDITLAQKVVNLQHPIGRVEIDSDGITHARQNEQYDIKIKVFGGDYVQLQLDYGDGSFEFLYVDEVGEVTDIARSHTYTELGVYKISVQAANDISFEQTSQDVSIEQDILSANLVVSNQPVLGEATVFTIETTGDAGAPAVPITLTIDYGDGHSATVVMGSLEDIHAPLSHSYVYEDYGWYNVEVLVHNNLGSIELSARHQVGQDVGFLDVAASQERLPLGDSVNISINSPAGSPSYFTVDLGDGSTVHVSVPEGFAPDLEEEEVVVVEELTTAAGESVVRRKREVELETGDGSRWNENSTSVVMVNEEVEQLSVTTTTPIVNGVNNAPGPAPRTPVSSNDVIVVTHTYAEPGRYAVRVSVQNPFNSAESWLCPDILVIPADSPTPQCDTFQVTPTIASSLGDPIISNRSLPLTIPLTHEADCGDLDTAVDYIWSAQWKTENQQWRPELNICEEPSTREVFEIPGNTLWYGTYKLLVRAGLWVTITEVDPVLTRRKREAGPVVDETSNGIQGQPTLLTADAEVYLQINPSPLVAFIAFSEAGDLEFQKTVTSTEILSIWLTKSHDPDVGVGNYTGMMFDLICYPQSLRDEVASKELTEVIEESFLVGNNSANTAFLREYGSCFNNYNRIAVMGYQVAIPQASQLVTSETVIFELFIRKDTRIMSHKTKLTIYTSTNPDDLLNNINDLLALGDTTAALAVVGMVADGLDSSNDTSDEAAAERAEMRSLLINAMDSVSTNIQNFDQLVGSSDVLNSVTEVPEEVTVESRATAANAMNNSAAAASAVGEDASVDQVSDMTVGMLNVAGNVMPLAEEAVPVAGEEAATTSPLGPDATHVNIIMTDRGDIIATGTVNRAGIATTLPGIIDVTPTASMTALGNENTTAPAQPSTTTESATSTEHAVTYVTMAGDTGTFTGVPMTMSTDVFSLSFSGSDSPAARTAREQEGTRLYSTPSMVTGDGWAATTIPSDWYESSTAYWYDTPDAIPSEDEEKCCERANGLCEWLEPPCPYLAEEDRKIYAWDNKTCFEIHPDDMAEIRERFDWYNLAKKNVLYANRKTTTTCAMGAMDSLGSVLLDKSDANSNVSLATDKIKFSVQAMSGDEAGTSRSMNGNNVPGGEISARGATGAKSLEMANPFTYSDSSNQIKSDVKSISLAGENGTTLVVENATEPFEIILPGKGVHAIPDLFFIMTSSEDIQMNHHVINMTSNYTVLYTTIFPATDGDIIEVFIKKTHYPNSTYYDYKVRLPLSETDVPDGVEDPHRWMHTFHPPENVTTWNDTYVLGIRLVQSQVDYLDTANKNNFTYTISSFITGCLFWNEETDNWSTDGCQVGPLTSANSTQCLCNHMTSFGSDFAVPPNTIDFATVFTAEKFLEALPVFITVALVLLIYVALLVWARRSDKADLLKWGATPLEDNLPTDTYHYQITVNTGVRKNAGTKSKINFILSGDEGDTGVRRLTDGKRKEHPNGSIYNYILSVECSLGPLTYLRIWHDNSGHMKKRSWFLDQVCVADLQSGDRKFFLCNRWLAVEEDDGMVDRILPVAGQEDLTSFKHLFSSSVRKKITNDHLWVSIFSRPTKSTFTRVQRISCCVCLLFLTMIANCMFFRDASEQEENVEALNIGPLQFTMQQLFISIVSTCIVFPPSLFIVTVFKKVKPKKNAIQHMNQNMSQKFKWRSITPGSSLWTNVEKSRFDKFKESMNNILTSHQRAKYESDDIPQEDHFAESKKKKKRFMFPYWMIYIAWIICILGIVTSAFFTVLYSMQWGRQKSLSWLQTFVLSFFQSVIVVQPVKVLLLAAFVSCIMKKPEEDDEEAVFDEQHAAPPPDSGYANVDDIQLQDIVARRKKAATEMPDVDVKALEAAREVRLKEIQMEAILKEFITYFIFVSVVFFLSYQARDVASFDYAQNIKNTLVDNSPVNFQDGITNYKLFWKYINEVFLPNVYSGPHYNGQDLTWREKLQIDDRNTIRVGVPRMRLQRIKEDTCLIEKPMDTFVKHCRDHYSWLDDDTADYLTNWVPITDENQADRNIMDCYADAFDGNGTSLKDEKSPWTYSTSIELKSAPYAGQLTAYKGGGYTFSFKRNVEKTTRLLRELEINNWLDTTARAVFLEFTLYNANVNLFASCIFLVEYMATGSAISKADIKVFRLSSYIGGFGVIVLLMELIYVGFIIYFMVHEGNKIRKQRLKYFQDFWNLMEFATLAMSITAIAMYAMKKIFGTVAMNTLHESESGEYVNFVTISIWDELFGFILACVVFFTTLKFIKMLKFNRRMGMLGDTIKLATKDLKIFSITFFIYFAAFTMFAYALFGTQLSSYGSFVSSAETLFAFALGDFDFYALQDTARILGPIFFFLYVGVIYIGLMGMFLTIIGESFSAVKASTDLQSNDYEIVEFITGKLKGIFGWS